MIKATRKDKTRVVDILIYSFEGDPHADWFVRPNNEGRTKRLRALMEFAFENALLNDSVYLSDDRLGTALWKKPQGTKFSLRDLLAKMKFASAVGFQKMQNIFAMERYDKAQHPKCDFLHLWFLGVLPEGQGKGIASSLLNPMLKDCDKKQIPVYLETANPKNVEIYKRKGFRTYHEWNLKDVSNHKVWFMRTLPSGTA